MFTGCLQVLRQRATLKKRMQMGIELDLKDKGLGVRGCRFSMIVDDGKVSVLNLEDGGGFEVSSAEQLLEAI